MAIGHDKPIGQFISHFVQLIVSCLPVFLFLGHVRLLLQVIIVIFDSGLDLELLLTLVLVELQSMHEEFRLVEWVAANPFEPLRLTLWFMALFLFVWLVFFVVFGDGLTTLHRLLLLLFLLFLFLLLLPLLLLLLLHLIRHFQLAIDRHRCQWCSRPMPHNFINEHNLRLRLEILLLLRHRL